MEFKKNNGKLEVYIYGVIGRGDTQVDTTEVIRLIERERNTGINEIVFYVNSEGGEVQQGSTLFNYLDRTDLKVTWIIDGIAASMAAVIISNPKHTVKASRYAKLMYHRVCGYVFGNSTEVRNAADMIDTFENDIVDMIAKRMKLDNKDVKSKYFTDGLDHYLSAIEAKELGLVDEIIEGRSGIVEPKNLTSSKDIFNYYNYQIINLKKSRKMEENLKSVAAILGLKDTSKEDVLNKVGDLQTDNVALKVENERLKSEQKEMEAKLKQHDKEKVKELVNQAIAEKKIGEDEREAYENLASKDFQTTQKVLTKLQGVGKVVNRLEPGETSTSEFEGKTWDELHKAGKLEALKRADKALFDKLFTQKYGRKS